MLGKRLVRLEGLEPYPGAKAGKQLPGQITGAGGILDLFPANIVVQDSSFCGLVDLGKCQIHTVPLNRACDSADENDRAVRLLPFDNSDMGQRVVDESVPVVIPSIVEEDEVARMRGRAFMEFAALTDVLMDESDPVGLGIGRTTLVQIDAMRQKNRTGHAGAVVGDPSAVDLDRGGADKFCSRAHDGSSAGS